MVRPIITGTLRWDPSIGTLPIGAWAELRRVVTVGDVAAYAALLGDDTAPDTMKKVAAEMSSDQIREAAGYVKDWMEKNKKIRK